jgi:ligand-binding SRPBCC domain-containing protein
MSETRQYKRTWELWIARPREEIFPFFAEAANLDSLTPSWLHFEVLTPGKIAMGPGALIDYRLRVHGVPLRWRTEIAEWRPPERFVDVQLRGPYRLWRHTHTFVERAGGTLCRDEVEYWPRGGAIINWLFVRRDIERIFQFRQRRLLEIFAGGAANQAGQRGE